MQYRELLHEWAWYFHEPKASENAVHECNNRNMHANECNKMFIMHANECNKVYVFRTATCTGVYVQVKQARRKITD